jgi:hypothetical protein
MKHVPEGTGLGSMEPFLVRTVLLRSEQYMGPSPPRAAERDKDPRRMTLRERHTTRPGEVAASANFARIVRYVGRANRPAVVVLALNNSGRIAGIFEYLDGGEGHILRGVAAAIIAMHADAVVPFANEAFGGPKAFLELEEGLALVAEGLEAEMPFGGVLGRDAWWSSRSRALHGYDGMMLPGRSGPRQGGRP